MKKKDIENLISFLLIGSFAVFCTLGGSYILLTDKSKELYEYFKLYEWKITIFDFEKFLFIVTPLIVLVSWFVVGIFIEWRFKVLIFRRNYLLFTVRERTARERPNLLRVISRKQKLLQKEKDQKENEQAENNP